MYVAALHVILKDPNIRNEQLFVLNKVPYHFRFMLQVCRAFGLGGGLNSKSVVSLSSKKSYFTCNECVYTEVLKAQKQKMAC